MSEHQDWNVLQGEELDAVCRKNGLEQSTEPPPKHVTPEERAALVAAWDQFQKDTDAYVKRAYHRSEKLSSDAYTFSVIKNADYSITTVLTQVKTGKTKTFNQASGSADGMHTHMLSLTDTLCDQWFNEKPAKKEKKK